MATEAEFTIAASDFPLGNLFEDLPDAKIELERVIPTSHGALPFFWVWNADTEELLSLLRSEPALESVEVIDKVEDGALFRAAWNANAVGMLTGILETEIILLSGEGTSEEWVFKVRAEDTDQIAAFQQYCDDHGIDATLSRIQALADVGTGQEYNLTPEQEAALVLAFEAGTTTTPGRRRSRNSATNSASPGRRSPLDCGGGIATSSGAPSSTNPSRAPELYLNGLHN